LQKKVFAANLRATGNGTWDFGYTDKSKYTGKIAYAPLVNGTRYWEIDVKEYAVGSGSFGSATIGNVIVDSGTSLVYLPQAVVEDYYSKIAGYEFTVGGSYTFPCNSTIPDFRFKIDGGKILSIPGSDVNFAVYDKAKGICTGAISSQLNSKYSILGNLFMKNYYVVHSREQENMPKMGFASH
jgi:aspergillopepsin I